MRGLIVVATLAVIASGAAALDGEQRTILWGGLMLSCTAQSGAFCRCYATAMVDMMTVSEADAIDREEVTPAIHASLLKKKEFAIAVCRP